MPVTIQPTQEELAVQEAREWPSQLPACPSWTAAEMVDYIETGVVDLASAKVALKAMVRMLAYLRDFTQIVE